jgi:hypothetical protein
MRKSNYTVVEYCRAVFKSELLREIMVSSCAPFNEKEREEIGKVSGCGIPPPRLIIPGICSNG